MSETPQPPASETPETSVPETPESSGEARSLVARDDKTTPEKRWKKRIKGILVDVLIVAAVFTAVQMWRGRNMLSSHSEAPAFTLVDLATSEPVSLSDFEGDRVVLNFWAPWCPVCRREFGMLNRFSEHLDDDEHLVSIVYDRQDLDYIRDFVRENDVRFQVLLADQHVTSDYRVQAFPTLYYISGRGQIRGKSTGLAMPWGMRARMGCAR